MIYYTKFNNQVLLEKAGIVVLKDQNSGGEVEKLGLILWMGY